MAVKVQYSANDRMMFEIECANLQDLFKCLAKVDECFTPKATSCGHCGTWTTIHKEIPTANGGTMYLRECSKCHASLVIGKTRDGLRIYPKWDDSDTSKDGWQAPRTVQEKPQQQKEQEQKPIEEPPF